GAARGARGGGRSRAGGGARRRPRLQPRSRDLPEHRPGGRRPARGRGPRVRPPPRGAVSGDPFDLALGERARRVVELVTGAQDALVAAFERLERTAVDGASTSAAAEEGAPGGDATRGGAATA